MLLGSVKSYVGKLSAQEVYNLCVQLIALSWKNSRTFDVKYNGVYALDRKMLIEQIVILLGQHMELADHIDCQNCLFASPFSRKQLLKLLFLLEHMV